MAEAVIGSIAEEIIAQLVPQALEKVSQFLGVKRELVQLQDTVSTLRVVLDSAEEQYYQSHQIQVWLDKVKDVFYEAQDVLEELNIEAMQRELRGPNEMIKEVRTFLSSSNQFAFKMKMSNKVREVRERIEAVKAHRGFHLDERPGRELRKREETHSFVCEGDIKGRDEDKKTVMNFLLNSNMKEHISVLPIVGIGGLGKTTLAQFVYNDEMVATHFDLKMWVCVSDDFGVKNIVKNMIDCGKKEAPSEVAMDKLQSQLKAKIDGKRYLLVLDDLWITEREPWLNLKTLLAGGARGSKILITTRLPLVAEITNTTLPHFLGGLSESASLELLMQMACRKEEDIQDLDMLAIGKEIATKCYGVPLIVRTVGSLLFFKKTKSEWLHFKDYELSKVSEREDGIKSVLRLSYDHLPSHLKHCFALCSLFPKDYEIKKQTLIDLWMAEGFIRPSHISQHLEDVANGYFMDLLWRNFFQNYRKGEETCKMHDMMHDLACSVAGNECRVVGDDPKTIHERTRHISVGDLPISHLKASPLRTFLSNVPWQSSETFLYSVSWQRSEVDLCQIIQRFKRLRILDLHSNFVGKVPRSIYKLKYLTYLDLSDNRDLKRLPNSIVRLQNLQTLNLNNCIFLEELPRDIMKLVSLRNLGIDGCWKLGYMPQGLGQLTSLHRLTRFILPKDKALAKNCCRLGELKGLNHIRGSLCIENLGSVTDAIVEFKDANLIGKQYLETLQLQWGNSHSNDAVIVERDEAPLDELRPHSNLQKLTVRGYKGESFPRWMMALPNLVELRLWYCRCKHLPPLGRLPSLVDLSIVNCTELDSSKEESGNIVSDFPDGLKSLRSVVFRKLPNLASLPPWIPQASNLESLEICDCQNLRELPEQIEALQSLQRLKIVNCPSLTSLPEGMRRGASLTSLSISDCAELDFSKEDRGPFNSLRSVEFHKLPKLASLPRWIPQASNLESLEICDCRNLRELPEQIEALQSLQRLYINGCPSLTSLPEGMRKLASLTNIFIIYCKELNSSKDESGNSISDSHGLNSLRSVRFHWLPKLASLPRWLLQANDLQDLEIWNCQNFKELPEKIEALQSLQRLRIKNCPSLTSLPEGMRRLASLVDLSISGCAELNSSKEGSGNIISDFHVGLQSLRSVKFDSLPKLAYLPWWVSQASNLESLVIRSCHSLRELPERIEVLQSLQRLDISHCPSLTSLPEGMRRLASLASLSISGCPELEERCKRDAGEDWHKIAHIPQIHIL